MREGRTGGRLGSWQGEREGRTGGKPGNQLVYCIKLQCAFVCVSVCTPPPLRHDRLTATKFGTHVWIDPGIIQAQTNLTHPGGHKLKSSGNVMTCPENQ